MSLRRLRQSAERTVYRVAGLPVAVRAALGPSDPLRSAFARHYWRPKRLSEWTELGAAAVLWPLALLLASAWFTSRNGPTIRRRCGKSAAEQFGEQLSLYFSHGVLPPWYYIFSLHDDGAVRAGTFIHRFETKTCVFRLLKPKKGSPLTDKARFADYCRAHRLRCVETLMTLDGGEPPCPLPDRDLFVKLNDGRGGRGAERWDRVGASLFEGPASQRLNGGQLLDRLVERSHDRPLIVQTRLRPHPSLARITSGALPTIRVLTCRNEQNRPEIMAAMIRTSFGSNRTVDNLHAGGIGASLDVETGRLGKASNLGADAQLGWLSHHPDTGAAIEGTVVPCWEQVKPFALAAHREFGDRVVVGWDIAVLEDGPILVEGNSNPDVDIHQRFMPIGFRQHRLAELLAHHLRLRARTVHV